MIYFDNAATTRMGPAALAAQRQCQEDAWGNPASPHRAGQRAARVLEGAREALAGAVGAAPRGVVFTSGGTEALNGALRSGARAGREQGRMHLVAGAAEHHAVLRTLAALEEEGHSVTLVPPAPDGAVRCEAVARALRPDTALVALMAASNETGVLQPAGETARLCREHSVLMLCDAVQAAGHIPLDVETLGADYVALSAHKFGGPKGIGALVCRPGAPLAPLLEGGGQEGGKRAGTPNVAGAAAMAAALAEAAGDEEAWRRTAELRDALQEALAGIPGAAFPGNEAPRLPGILSARFAGVDGEELVLHLSLRGICAAAGAACTTGEAAGSHVLRAMGLSPQQAKEGVRFSLGGENTREEVDTVAAACRELAEKLRRK